ncbi:putative hydroxypyruvate reductase [compost metagenome]
MESNAGALMSPCSYRRAPEAGLNPLRELDNNNGYGFFAELGDLVTTGPTRTNVNDFRAILILEASEK